MFAGKDKQILDDFRRPFSLRVDLLKILVALLRQSLVAQQQLGVATDARERVVQFVGDARDQLADSREFFRLNELLFKLATVGQITGDAVDALDAGAVQHHMGRNLKKDRLLVAAHQFKLKRLDAAPQEQFIQHRFSGLPRIGRTERPQRMARQLLDRVASQLESNLVNTGDA